MYFFNFTGSLTWFLVAFIFLSTFIYLRYTFYKKTINTTAQRIKELKNLPEFTLLELSKYNNSNPNLPVYLAIQGTVFDVSSNRQAYPCGTGYGILAGTDATRALAKSSLSKSDSGFDWSDFTENEKRILSNWYKFFERKYPIVGRVVKNIPDNFFFDDT